jgi:hypothetical protein
LTTDLIVRSQEVFTLPDPDKFKKDMEAIKRFQQIVQETMIPDQDFGIIPGTTKPTLLKPGAEKITKVMGLADVYEIMDRQEDWDKPFFRYLIKCRLVAVNSGVTISEGMGECNSYESKYRYRDAQRKCPYCDKATIFKSKQDDGWFCWVKKGGCGAQFQKDDPAIINQDSGKIENEDIFSMVNTILKMAEKRALVDAALHAGRLSNVFTQDIEDIPGMGNNKPIETTTRTTRTEPAKQPAAGTTPVADRPATEKQVQLLKQKADKMCYNERQLEDMLFVKFAVGKLEDVKMGQVNDVIAAIEKGEGLGK